MFTGIITDIGRIEAVTTQGDLRVRIGTGFDTSTVALGASIACSGVCLTVVEIGPGWFAVDVSHETVSRTAAGQWTEGAPLNLERSLKVGDELGGHIVSGHVDGTGRVETIRAEGGSMRVAVLAPPSLAPLIAPKGSIAIDGVSLTVNEVEDGAEGTRFGVNIIPHTATATTFAAVREGQEVNLEIDVLARYLKRMEQYLERRG